MRMKMPLPRHAVAHRPAHPRQPGRLVDRAEAGQGGRLRLRPSHQRILDAFQRRGALTPDELAAEIDRSVFYTRPRCSELRAMGLLRPTGETRRNASSGLRAMVLSP